MGFQAVSGSEALALGAASSNSCKISACGERNAIARKWSLESSSVRKPHFSEMNKSRCDTATSPMYLSVLRESELLKRPAACLPTGPAASSIYRKAANLHEATSTKLAFNQCCVFWAGHVRYDTAPLIDRHVVILCSVAGNPDAFEMIRITIDQVCRQSQRAAKSWHIGRGTSKRNKMHSRACRTFTRDIPYEQR